MVAHAHKQCKRAGVSSLGSRGQCAVRISQKISKQPTKADTIIKFVVNDPRWAADDDGPSPYVHLTKKAEKRDLKYLQDADEVVLDAINPTLVIDYPMKNECKVQLGPQLAGFTRNDIVKAVGKAYRSIYRKEEETSTVSVERMSDRYPGCMLMNRADTNGKYGIYAHYLSDLALHTVRYHPCTNTLTVVVDS